MGNDKRTAGALEVAPGVWIPYFDGGTLARRWLALSEADRAAIWAAVETRWLYSCKGAGRDRYPPTPSAVDR
jgi:hypothetical protein